MSAVHDAVEGYAALVNLREAVTNRSGEWHPRIVERENAFLEVCNDQGENF
jgi:hypothetical protein